MSGKKKNLIGDDPLGNYVSGALHQPVAEPPAKAAPMSAPVDAEKRVPFSSYLPEGLLARVRNTAAALAGPPLYLSLADLTENALRTEVERLERELNKGNPFPTPPKKRK
jgi:hypothetical protein